MLRHRRQSKNFWPFSAISGYIALQPFQGMLICRQVGGKYLIAQIRSWNWKMLNCQKYTVCPNDSKIPQTGMGGALSLKKKSQITKGKRKFDLMYFGVVQVYKNNNKQAPCDQDVKGSPAQRLEKTWANGPPPPGNQVSQGRTSWQKKLQLEKCPEEKNT